MKTEKSFSFMSNLQSYYHFKLVLQKVAHMQGASG